MGPKWGPLGPVGPRWAPCWPHEPCYQGTFPIAPEWQNTKISTISLQDIRLSTGHISLSYRQYACLEEVIEFFISSITTDKFTAAMVIIR